MPDAGNEDWLYSISGLVAVDTKIFDMFFYVPVSTSALYTAKKGFVREQSLSWYVFNKTSVFTFVINTRSLGILIILLPKFKHRVYK